MTAHVFISGFVQGVGYRQFVKRNAIKLSLAGWVKNLSDNRVEAVFCGPEEQIKQIISICEKGPFLSEVKDIQVNFENQKQIFKSFDIIK